MQMKTGIDNYQAIVAGHICLDLHPAFLAENPDQDHVRQMLVPGRLINMDRMVLSTGGAVSNTGRTLQQLGTRTRLMGKVGRDFLGSAVRELIAGEDTEDTLIVDPESSTSYSIVIAPPGVDRIFLHHPGANDTFSAADLNPDSLPGVRLFHFGYPPLMRRMYIQDGRELAELLAIVKENAVTTSLDMALPDPASAAGQADWESILKRVLPLCDIFLPSIEELLYMLNPRSYAQVRSRAGADDFVDHFDLADLSRLSEQLLELGVKIAVIKLGKKGMYVRTAGAARLAEMGGACPADTGEWAERELLSPAFTVANIASTSGAGDASIAGFLAALLHGCSIVTALRAANAVAARKIQFRESVGRISPLPSILELMSEMSEDTYAVEQKSWTWLEDQRIWAGRSDGKQA